VAVTKKAIENIEESSPQDDKDFEERLLESIIAYERQLKRNAERAEMA
jgi:hypothetical protein